MEVNFWVDECSRNDRNLVIDMKFIRNRYDDEIYSTLFRLDISEPIELSLVYDALRAMEKQTSIYAAEKLNLMKVCEHRHIQHLEERIRFLEKELREMANESNT